jgi:DNA-damage-inducible protein J
MKSNVLSIKTEPQLKSDVEKLYGSFGITVSDAVNMFFYKSLMVGGLPFELKIDKPYVITKQDLDNRIDNLKSGKGIARETVEVEE